MIIFKKTYDFVLDLLFPKFCVGCGKEGGWICSQCQEKIILIKKPTCPICNQLTPKDQFCSKCRSKTYLTGVIVAAYYQEGPLKEAIHTFKYDGVFELAKDLGQMLIKAMKQIEKPKNFVIIPVPLHYKRQAKRGFNQAELLAKEIVKVYPHCSLLTNSLVRTKQTKKTQVELSGRERRENIKGIFSWQGTSDELKDQTILLVDDIYTTGATLNECAKVLRQKAGARQVWGVVLAKA